MFGDKKFDGVGYPTPSSIPVERGCRTATIPANAEWYGVFMGVLETLTHDEAWQQFEGGISREDAACYWQEIIDSLYLSAETSEGCMESCCPLFRRNPATGLPQVSYDDGLSWDYFPDGPYEGSDGPPIAAPPPALAQGSDEEDICAAAWNGADVIANFYEQTAGEAAAGLYNTVLNVNKFLFQLNQSLLRILVPDAYQLEQALGFFDFDWPTYASAPTLDNDAMKALRCLLIDNATVTGGIVSFNQPAVLADVVSELGTNPGVAVALLIGYMDVAGLNAAGGVNLNDHPDCSECGWTEVIDLKDTLPAYVTVLFGSWSSGNGVAAASNTAPDQQNRQAIVQVDIPSGADSVTDIIMYTSVSIVGTSPVYVVNDDLADVISGGLSTGDQVYHLTLDALPTIAYGQIFPSQAADYSGTGYITKITIKGTGTNPF